MPVDISIRRREEAGSNRRRCNGRGVNGIVLAAMIPIPIVVALQVSVNTSQLPNKRKRFLIQEGTATRALTDYTIA